MKSQSLSRQLILKYSTLRCKQLITNNDIIKGEYSQNTTCVEKMVYSAIETTCFGLYWPSSGFYNIKEESIRAVKTVWG